MNVGFACENVLQVQVQLQVATLEAKAGRGQVVALCSSASAGTVLARTRTSVLAMNPQGGCEFLI